MVSKKLGKGTDFDLSVSNAQTGEGGYIYVKQNKNRRNYLYIIDIY